MNLFLFQNALGMAAYIRALQTQGALRSLAEPNLIAMDGQQASFLAGGEFPIPMVQGGGDKSTGERGVQRIRYSSELQTDDHR